MEKEKSPEKKSNLGIGPLVEQIGSSDTYTLARNDSANEGLSELDIRRRSIRLAAINLQETRPSGRRSLEDHKLNITAQLTTFGQSLQELNKLEKQGAQRQERLPALRRVAEFNHAIKEMVDDNQSLRFAEVLSFITNMNQQINGSEHAGEGFEQEIRGRLVGMRHEIAYEQIIGRMPGVECRQPTVDEDLNGADIFVSFNDSPMVPIDVKASFETAQSAQAEASRRGFDASHIVWSHVNDEEFDGGFRISEEVIAAKSGYVYNDLLNAVVQQNEATRRS